MKGFSIKWKNIKYNPTANKSLIKKSSKFEVKTYLSNKVVKISKAPIRENNKYFFSLDDLHFEYPRIINADIIIYLIIIKFNF